MLYAMQTRSLDLVWIQKSAGQAEFSGFIYGNGQSLNGYSSRWLVSKYVKQIELPSMRYIAMWCLNVFAIYCTHWFTNIAIGQQSQWIVAVTGSQKRRWWPQIDPSSSISPVHLGRREWTIGFINLNISRQTDWFRTIGPSCYPSISFRYHILVQQNKQQKITDRCCLGLLLLNWEKEQSDISVSRLVVHYSRPRWWGEPPEMNWNLADQFCFCGIYGSVTDPMSQSIENSSNLCSGN
jgi:hypothetical protein